MFILRRRLPSRHGYDVHQKRRNHLVVLLKQMQKKLVEIQKRRTQAQMDKVLRQRRERTRLKPQALFTGGCFQPFFPISAYCEHSLRQAWLRPVKVNCKLREHVYRLFHLAPRCKVYPILIRVTHRKNGFINTSDISVR
jgi:hypothetical protein